MQREALVKSEKCKTALWDSNINTPTIFLASAVESIKKKKKKLARVWHSKCSGDMMACVTRRERQRKRSRFTAFSFVAFSHLESFIYSDFLQIVSPTESIKAYTSVHKCTKCNRTRSKMNLTHV